MQMSLPKKAPRKFMQVKEKRKTTTNAPFAQNTQEIRAAVITAAAAARVLALGNKCCR
jgi:hypothetical protein